ncbi:hypothetical protein QFC21_001073 [Naganishia friedmannii]|uniref:Uncharacterized protein n=1 Tax=Naganishia friedmannii TaxID=89922 RepID=A0ACC2W8T4_9TREE|nr:hypothetical protein QFC21_001073 [Naganishia friedmannii]
MHLPDHIANLNSYSPPSPPPHPFPNLFGSSGPSQAQNGEQSGSYQNEVDSSLDAQLAHQLALWTNTDFTFNDDIGPFPGLEEFDVGGEEIKQNAEKEKDQQNEDEMDMREMFEGKVRGMKGSKNVLMDRRREMEMEQQEKAANYNSNTHFREEMNYRTGNNDGPLATANRATAAAVDGMPAPNNTSAPPPTPSLLHPRPEQTFGQLQNSQQAHIQQPNLQTQANDLASFLSQFYNSNSTNSSNVQPQVPQHTPSQPSSQMLPRLPAQQQMAPAMAQPTLAVPLANSQNPSIAESLVHLLQGLTGQYNLANQQQHPAPPIVMPQPIAASHNMSQVAQWVDRQTPQTHTYPIPPIVPSHVERPHLAQKRSFVAEETDLQVSANKKARLPAPPSVSDDINSIEVNGSENERRTSSAAVSVAGDLSTTTRKTHAHIANSRPDADLEPKGIPMGKGLVMVDGEIITHEEDKRRRNTAASARFRMKKKEREHALEKNTQVLQDRVSQLEREMESLRKENGWLRALVINGAPQPLSSPELKRVSLSSASISKTSS